MIKQKKVCVLGSDRTPEQRELAENLGRAVILNDMTLVEYCLSPAAPYAARAAKKMVGTKGIGYNPMLVIGENLRGTTSDSKKDWRIELLLSPDLIIPKPRLPEIAACNSDYFVIVGGYEKTDMPVLDQAINMGKRYAIIAMEKSSSLSLSESMLEIQVAKSVGEAMRIINMDPDELRRTDNYLRKSR